MAHPDGPFEFGGNSTKQSHPQPPPQHQPQPVIQRIDSSGSSGQPATPRMLRNVSGSLKNSRTDVTLTEDSTGAMQDFGQSLQSHLQSHQQQKFVPVPNQSQSHSRTGSINRSPSASAYSSKKKPELLPPASISSPKEQQKTQMQTQSHGQGAQSHPHSDSHQQSQSHSQSHGQSQHPSSQQTQPGSSEHGQAQQFHRKSIGDWDFIKTIGAGSMGKVKLAQHNSTGEVCAVKIVPRAAKLFQRAHANDPPVLNPQQAAQRQKDFEKEVARDKRTIREAALGRLLFHPFICRLYEMVPMTNHYYMLFEYVEGGQMLDYIVSHGSLKEKNARKFVRGIASALDYCHKNSVVHRDLKIENIMINQKGDIKIIDFGLSNLYSPTTLLKTYCGSLYFAAPELLSARPYTGPEVDIWSFGVVLYVLVCGKVPFDDKSVSVLHEKIKRGNVEYPEFLSKECVSLLSRMLVVDPSKRATLYEIMQHPWMNRGYDHPPSSYLPKRIPLSLPLDPLIIKNIASFDLGSEQAITQELTNILSSVEYQMSCENWYKVAKQGREYNSASNSHLLPDPTAGFHPLISIYFLIDEMRKRKKAKEQAIELQKQQREQSQREQKEKEQQSQQQQQQQQVQPQSSHAFAPISPPPVPQVTPQLVQGVPGFAQSSSQNSTPQQPPKDPFNPPAQQQPAPSIPFPEAAHTSPIIHASSPSYNKASPQNDHQQRIPDQQPTSPRNSTSTPETLDPNAGKGSGFNSLLRRLSTKSKKASNSPSKNSGEFSFPGNAPPVPAIHTPDDDISPQQSFRNDPMVRRGVSMKITAKEKSSGSRVNLLSSPKRGGPEEKKKSDENSSSPSRKNEGDKLRVNTSLAATGADPARHFRSSSATTNQNPANKFSGFVPVEYLPPLPNINNLSPNVATRNSDGTVKKLHPTARAKSVGGQLRKDAYAHRTQPQAPGHHPPLPNSLATQNSDEIIEAYFDDVTLDDYTDIPPQLSEEQIIEQFNNAKQGTMPSIEYPKTLFLKGFFSVQTTSTKPLPVIRYNIISVLSKLGVKYQEVKGGFICSHNPSLQEYASATGTPTITVGTEEKDLYGDAFKSTSSSIERSSGDTNNNNNNGPPRIKTPDQEKTIARQPSLNLNTHVITSPSSEVRTHRSSNSIGGGNGSGTSSATSGNSHRRKFSIGQSILTSYRKKNGSQVAMPPNTPATTKVIRGMYPDDGDEDGDTDADNSRQYGDGDSVDSLNGIMIGGGSDMLVSSRLEHKARHQHTPSNASSSTPVTHSSSGGSSSGKSPLKFEILVVKVPLVGLYGVQFKKILGNTWNYKTLAGEILNDLNL